MKYSLSIIYFMDYAFGAVHKKASPYPWLSKDSPMLPCRSFVVLHIMFKSVIHFELVFMKCARYLSRFIFFAHKYPIIVAQFTEKTTFVSLYFLYSFVKDQLTIFIEVCFWALYSEFILQWNKNEKGLNWVFKLWPSKKVEKPYW